MDKQQQYKQALTKCMQLCSTKEYCEYDIKNILTRKALAQNEIEKIIQQLKTEKFINTERYCQSFVNDKFNIQGWGRIKIEFQLQQKGLPSDAIQQALNNINPSEYKEKIKYFALQKIKNLKSSPSSLNYEQKTKVLRFLASKGFESGYAIDVVNELTNIDE